MDPPATIKSEVVTDYPSPGPAIDSASDQKRRSSSRSIKRKRFDDEIVEYSLGLPPAQINRITGRSRTQSQTYGANFGDLTPGSPQTPHSALISPANATPIPPLGSSLQSTPSANQSSKITSPQLAFSATPQTMSISSPAAQPVLADKRRATKNAVSSSSSSVGALTPIVNAPAGSLSSMGPSSKKSKKTRITGNQVSTKDLGRWKPIDDLALIIGVQQTNDLRMVHRGTKFSCKFTVQELQSRWCSLLYEEPISRLAIAAMRNLHPELVESVQSKALYTTQEEELLGTIKSTESPTTEIFQELLDKNAQTFYAARTAKALAAHWQLMKQYTLLPDQQLIPQPITQHETPLSFNEAEEQLNDSELTAEQLDETVELELALADRANKKEIRMLENELTRWTVLVDSLTGIGFTPEFDNQTLAVLRGRLVRYLMRSREITFGRTTKDHTVDVDLTLEGPAHKVSRRQGTIKLRSNGDFFVVNEGKRPLFIDGSPLLQGAKGRLNNNTVIEIAGLRFIFLINSDLINAIRQESAKMNGPLT